MQSIRFWFRTIAFSLVCLLGLAEAAIPDSIDGYRLYLKGTVRSPDGGGFCRSVEFDDQGQFSDRYVFDDWLSVGPSEYYFSGSYQKMTQGSYAYRRNGDTTAVINWSPSDPMTLQFTSDLAGTGYGSGYTFNFVLTPPDKETHPLTAISSRARVTPADNAIVGFIVRRSGDYLLRACGPVLSSYQVTNVWAAPHFDLYDASGAKLGIWYETTGRAKANVPGYLEYCTWDATPAFAAVNKRAFDATKVYPFDAGSNDVAVVVHLEPGSYAMVASADAGDPGGVTLLEVYEYP